MKVCAHPGCPALVSRQGANRCEAHDKGAFTAQHGNKNHGVDARTRRAVFRRDGGRCHWCGIVTRDWHADHLIPHADGGPSSIDNLVTACKRCNEDRGRKLGSDRANGY